MSTFKKARDLIGKDGNGLQEFFEGQGRWKLIIDKNNLNEETSTFNARVDWRAESPFGSVESAIVIGPEGEPVFDRPVYREAPNINAVVWGKGKSGEVRLAVINQPRPHSDDPENSGEHETVVFGQIVMGFLERIIGKDMITRYESIESGSAREASEEAGASVVIKIENPEYPYLNPAPSFVATWSNLVFIEVNLEKIEKLKKDRMRSSSYENLQYKGT